MPEKEYRIAKVASELNHSFQVLVDHLNKQGFGVESKPTAKINEEMYQALLREFRADKELKDEANKLKVRREEKPVLPAAKLTKGLPKKEELEEMPVVEEVEVIKPESEPVVVEAPVVEVEKSVEVPVLEKKEEEEDGKTVLKGPKILGKIEIPDKKKKKEEREPEKRKEETKKEEIKEAPVVKKEEPAKEEKKEKKEEKVEKVEKSEVPVVAEVKEKKEELAELKVEAVESDTEVVSGEDETEKIETKFEKLSGPKVLGKIEIKTEAKSGIKKLAEEARDEEREKRKRKRKKVTAEKIQINEKVKEQEKTQPNNNRPATTDKPAVNQRDVQNKVKSTMGRVGGAGQNKGFKQKLKKQQREKTEFRRMEEAERRDKESKILKVTEFLSANELASLMDAPVNKVIQVCFNLGLMVSINQRLDAETITVLADEFGYAVEFQDAEAQLDVEEVEDAAEDLEDRPPIVTVMGHVDHGKTSLLDYVRKTNVIAGEAGGITQHIGAYEVTLPDQRKITFLDTPGHEAFTAMRARGAKVTDIAIIVVAADDSVMPQTREAIAHAQAAGVPMVFAINKIDKDGANPDKIREELSGMNILVEEWGGKFQCQEISAKKGLNIDKLLDKVLLEAEFLQLKANPNRAAKGTVIEASLEKGRGIVASVLVQNGTLSIGDHLVAGPYYAKVKALFNERGAKITEAPPSTPVKMLGFSDSPAAGDVFLVMEDEDSAKDLANKRYQLVREQGMRTKKHITLDEIGRRLAVGNFKELNLIVKGDVDGSVEALSDALLKLSTEEIQINVIHSGVGQITESDVLLASASDAIIVGFQVRPSAKAKALAENEEIDIRAYSVIYKAIEEIRSAMEGMLSPEVIEKITGNVEVRDVFRISKVGTIAGCYVLDGSIERKSKVRIIRDGVVLHSGELLSLKRYKDDVKEVNKGYECGLQISGYNDIEVGDHIEVYKEEQVQRKLD